MIINTVDVEGSTVWIDPSADRTADMEGDIQAHHTIYLSTSTGSMELCL